MGAELVSLYFRRMARAGSNGNSGVKFQGSARLDTLIYPRTNLVNVTMVQRLSGHFGAYIKVPTFALISVWEFVIFKNACVQVRSPMAERAP